MNVVGFESPRFALVFACGLLVSVLPSCSSGEKSPADTVNDAGGTGPVSQNDGGQPPATDGGTAAEAGPPPHATTTPSAKPPAQGALFGAFVGVGTESPTDFTAEEAILGREWAIDNRFYSYEDWINDRTKWDIAQHKIPLVTWEPHEKLDEIIAGKHDEMLHTRAAGAKALGAEIYLRWGHEMNGNWYPWSGAQNGGATGGAEKYIAAYRHVHDLFVKDGATNVIWVWCPLVADVPNEGWNHWTKYYPGDEYVDWVGLDAYNWGSSSSCCTWMSFADLVTDLYRDYEKVKPLMLPETASAEVGGNKGAWITEMHRALKQEFSAIKAVVWFDINKETDWRIASSPGALAAYRAMALDPYFNP
jgi:endoglucanase